MNSPLALVSLAVFVAFAACYSVTLYDGPNCSGGIQTGSVSSTGTCASLGNGSFAIPVAYNGTSEVYYCQYTGKSCSGNVTCQNQTLGTCYLDVFITGDAAHVPVSMVVLAIFSFVVSLL